MGDGTPGSSWPAAVEIEDGEKERKKCGNIVTCLVLVEAGLSSESAHIDEKIHHLLVSDGVKQKNARNLLKRHHCSEPASDGQRSIYGDVAKEVCPWRIHHCSELASIIYMAM